MNYNFYIFLALISFFIMISIKSHKFQESMKTISYDLKYSPNMVYNISESDKLVYNISNTPIKTEAVYDLANSPDKKVSDNAKEQADDIALQYWINENSKKLESITAELKALDAMSIPYLEVGLIETNGDLFGGLSFNILPPNGDTSKQMVNFVLPKGRKGPVGLKGPSGDRGKPGEKGDRGQRGDDGLFVVPVPKSRHTARLI